jgi:hypothetical protein
MHESGETADELMFARLEAEGQALELEALLAARDADARVLCEAELKRAQRLVNEQRLQLEALEEQRAALATTLLDRDSALVNSRVGLGGREQLTQLVHSLAFVAYAAGAAYLWRVQHSGVVLVGLLLACPAAMLAAYLAGAVHEQ